MAMRTIRLIFHVLLLAVTLVACKSESSKQTTFIHHQTELRTLKDYNIPDKDRNPVALMSLTKGNRITIIDLWASWCRPCLEETPNIKALYVHYAKSGLGIIGISLDNDYHAWQYAISRMGMDWPQLSELRGWDTSIVQENGIDHIPYTIIINENGQILKTDIRGEELTDFIRTYFHDMK